MFVVNPCAQPITSRGGLINFVTSYRLDQVSTKQPYKNGAKSRSGVRIGPDKQLELSDLRTDCHLTKVVPPERNFVVESEYNGACEPLLVWRDDLMNIKNKEVDWSNCGRVFGGNFGLFDPPMPVAPCTIGDCANQGADNAGLRPPPPTTPAVSQGTTSAIASPSQTLPASGPTATSKSVVSSQNPGSRPGVEPASNNPTPQNEPASNNPSTTTPSNIPTEKNQPVTVFILVENGYATSPAQPQPPNGAGDAASNNNPNPPSPAPTLTLIATRENGNAVFASQGAAPVVVGSETISAGGPAITILNVGIVSLLPSGGGMVIKNNEDVTTYAYESNVAPAESPKAVLIATLAGGSVLSAIPGASNEVPGQGALSLSPTSLIFLSNAIQTGNTASKSLSTGEVITARLRSSTLILRPQTLSVNSQDLSTPEQGIMSPSPTGLFLINNGITTTHSIPHYQDSSHRTSHIQVVSMSNGSLLTVAPLGSLVVIGGKTLTQGGPIPLPLYLETKW